MRPGRPAARRRGLRGTGRSASPAADVEHHAEVVARRICARRQPAATARATSQRPASRSCRCAPAECGHLRRARRCQHPSTLGEFPAVRAGRCRPARRPHRRPPTWSRSKCVSTSRSMRSTPDARRHASSGSGSGPVSMSAIAPAERRSTASPWPTSHARMLQSAGRVNRPATEASAAPPADDARDDRQQRAPPPLVPLRCRGDPPGRRGTTTTAPIAMLDGGESGNARPALEPRHLIARKSS